ncbi:MAG: type II toxin-antitoxin system RelE/ParE family toxin [Ferruginibacter sp.]
MTPAAIEDIQTAMDYYNSRSLNLGFRFADEVDNSLKAIAKMPAAYGYRFKNVRAKLLYKFPFLIFFTVDDNKFTVEVLRILNTHQDSYGLKVK